MLKSSKKIFLIFSSFFILSNTTLAEESNLNEDNYTVTEFKCNNEEAIIQYRFGDTDKFLVALIENNVDYVWNSKTNECTLATDNDYLEMYSLGYETRFEITNLTEKSSEDNSVGVAIDEYTDDKYILNEEEYDENETYYQYEDEHYKLVRSATFDVNNLNNYYILVDDQYVQNTEEYSESTTYYELINQEYVIVNDETFDNLKVNESLYIKVGENYEEATLPYADNVDYYGKIYADYISVDNANANDVNSYYVLKSFKHIASKDLDPNKNYYQDDGSDTDTYELITDIQNITNYLNVYEKTVINEPVIKVKKNASSAILNSILTNDDDSLDLYINNDKLLYQVSSNYDEELDEYTEFYYYDENGKELTMFRNKEIEILDKFILVLNNSKVDIYNSEFNIVKSIDVVGDYIYSSNFKLENGEYIEIITSLSEYYYVLSEYKILDGINQTYDNEDMTFRFSGNCNLFKELKLNGQIVNPKYYTVKSGSTIITLKKELLDTLVNGEYDLTATYTDGGIASVSFSVNKETSTSDNIVNLSNTKIANPKTYDGISTSICLYVISLTSLISLIISRKLRKNN